jgi:hypothetical protein
MLNTPIRRSREEREYTDIAASGLLHDSLESLSSSVDLGCPICVQVSYDFERKVLEKRVDDLSKINISSAITCKSIEL